MKKNGLKVTAEYHKIRHKFHSPTRIHRNKKKDSWKNNDWKKEED